MARQQRRILRNYRNWTPSRFHAFNQRVRTALSDSEKFPESTWAANPTLIQLYFAASAKHDSTFQEALYRSILVIAQRDALQAQLVEYLDEIAAVLEALAVRNPYLLLASGFDLVKERRSGTRTKPAQSTAEVSSAEQQGSNP